jgi:hypothetical protein
LRDPFVGELVVTVESADVVGDEGLHAVAQAQGYFTEGNAGSQPGGGGSVPGVVGA